MKKCPNCTVEMERIRYEGFGVDQCRECHGYFVRKSSMEGIKRTQDVQSSDLMRNAQKAETTNKKTSAFSLPSVIC